MTRPIRLKHGGMKGRKDMKWPMMRSPNTYKATMDTSYVTGRLCADHPSMNHICNLVFKASLPLDLCSLNKSRNKINSIAFLALAPWLRGLYLFRYDRETSEERLQKGSLLLLSRNLKDFYPHPLVAFSCKFSYWAVISYSLLAPLSENIMDGNPPLKSTSETSPCNFTSTLPDFLRCNSFPNIDRFRLDDKDGTASCKSELRGQRRRRRRCEQRGRDCGVLFCLQCISTFHPSYFSEFMMLGINYLDPSAQYM